VTCNSTTTTHTECTVIFPLQNRYTNASQYYSIRTYIACLAIDTYYN